MHFFQRYTISMTQRKLLAQNKRCFLWFIDFKQLAVHAPKLRKRIGVKLYYNL